MHPITATHLKLLSTLSLFASTTLAACAPCARNDALIKTLRSAESSASVFCSSYNQATVTTTLEFPPVQTQIKTQTQTITFTVPASSTAVVTTTVTETVSQVPVLRQRNNNNDADDDDDSDPLNTHIIASSFPPGRISSACSCLVPRTALPTITVTQVPNNPGAPPPTTTTTTTTTVQVTRPAATLTVTATSTVTVTVTAPPPADACPAGKPNDFCCQNVAAWSTNSAIWGGVCGYNPSDPSELVAARCIIAPSAGCSSLRRACCAGFIPGQCSLGTNCVEML